MQIPILSGIYSDESANYRNAYPINLIPVPKQNGVSSEYLSPSEGIASFVATSGQDRGGIFWNGFMYRVIGTTLKKIAEDGTQTSIGTIAGTGYVTLDYSFDYLAISGGGLFYLYDGTTLTQVTDTDLGTVLDFIWIDGYFMTTDGNYLVVTDLNNPFSVNPLKYGSSEASPDPIISVQKIHNEVYAVNRYTIEVFNDVGGSLFPFQRVEGAQIQKGSVGTFANCIYMDTIAFMGSGWNEPISIYMGASGQTNKIATREIDEILSTFTETELSSVLIESRQYKGHQFLYVHLADRTLVYDIASSQITQTPIWFTLSSGLNGVEKYRARNFVFAYNKWYVGDTTDNAIGYMTDTVSTHYGDKIGWEFSTLVIYNSAKGAIVHDVELVGLMGRVAFGANPTVWTSYSVDGLSWSQEKPILAGKQGNYQKRLKWFKQGYFNQVRSQKFRGTSDAHIGIASLEATLEPMAV